MTDEPDIEELKEQTQKGTRAAAAADDARSFEEVIQDQFEAMDAGEASKTLSFRDEFSAALIYAAEEDEQIRENLLNGLEREADQECGADRSAILRLAVRDTLKRANPGLWSEVATAHTSHQMKNR